MNQAKHWPCSRWPLCWRRGRWRQAKVKGVWRMAILCDRHRDHIHH